MTIASSTASSEFLKNPYSFYDTLRAVHPIYKGSFLKYPGWYVTGYEETAAILKDARFKVRTPLPESLNQISGPFTCAKSNDAVSEPA